ncbi:MAG: hypothetical protein ACXVZX_16065 [Terriglobales bacterium]
MRNIQGVIVGKVASIIKRRLFTKKVAAAVLVLVVLWGAGCLKIYSAMRKPPEQFGRFMMKVPAAVAFLAFPFETMWMHARDGILRVGDRAPDFALTKLDKTATVQLSELNRQKPVVLVFGSYT